MERFPLVVGLIFLIALLAEIFWSYKSNRNIYNFKETLSNLSMMVVNNLLKPAALAWTVFVLTLVEPWQMFRLPESPLSFLVTFVVADFAYYWYHRCSHEFSFLWTMHYTHHSSPWMNLTTAVRLNWVAKFISPIFFMPLVVLGIPPTDLGIALALGLLYQFILHTESIGHFGWFEGKLFNTPSAHRVHHGSNPHYIDKNFAGVFILWDRLFGTYQAESEPVRYGVTTGFLGHNPLRIQFTPLLKYVKGEWRSEKQQVLEQS